LVFLAAEGYYSDPGNGGNRAGCAWEMVGFRPGPAPAYTHIPTPASFSLQTTHFSEVEAEYDAIVIGAGAAGGVVAAILAEADKRVLLVERGRWQPYEQVGRDHLRNHRLALYGHNTGPLLAGHPRVFVDSQGREKVVNPHEGGYHNNAMGVGGGTRVYGAQAWRFLPADFQMASRYGIPEGSSLADWPFDYDAMELYYDRAEWEIGVAGLADPCFHGSPRQRDYPMPPVPSNPRREILARGADKLGWSTGPVPLLINTAPYKGRPACVQCGACVGFACPSESKNGTHNTMIPRALATGNCTLLCEAQAERIETDKHGRVTGVSLVVETGDQVQRLAVRAKQVIVSAGAIESARLLLNSASSRHPHGLGNAYDQVGRNLQGHLYPGALGLFEADLEDGNGPGVSVATCSFNHGNPGIIGGGMLANEFIKLPIIFWRGSLPPDLPRWGLANKTHMREAYHRTLHITGPIQEIPNPDSRVTVDPKVKDRFGIPVARLSGTVHPESLRVADFMRARAEEWLWASGAKRVWSYPTMSTLSAGQHQAGACRMGVDPQTSVTDPWGRVHGHENLYVIDGSLHVTNGGFNPVLTIMALAFRCAEHLARQNS
jgi:choline dehydrogenase-like flavoprotein